MVGATMNSRVLKLIIILNVIYYSIFSGTANGSKEKIILAADYWCPYNCDPKDKNPGYLVELAKKAFEIYDIDVEYKLMPWSEALLAVKEGRINGVIGFDKEDHDLLVTRMPQAYSMIGTFTRKDSNWVYDNLQSFDNQTITLILDYNLGRLVKQYFATNYVLNPKLFIVEAGDHAVGNAINNLLEKKVNIYIEDEKVVNHYIIQNNLSAYIRNAGATNKNNPEPIFIAFSHKLKTSESYVRMLEEGIESLGAIGDLGHLQKKYEIIAPK